MHSWGDPGVDWDGINAAAEYIGKGLRKWGRVDVAQYKEKYGCVRVYCMLGLGSLHQLTHPGYVWNRWPQWLWKLQFTAAANWIVRFLNLFFKPYHEWLYRRYYRKAVERWPHLRREILVDANFPELLQFLEQEKP